MKELAYLLTLEDSDFKMILDGLDALKSKDFGMDVMEMMFESMIKPSPDDIEGMKVWNNHKKGEEAKKLEKKLQQAKLKEEVDLIKAKLILMLDMKRKEETKSPSRQITNKA